MIIAGSRIEILKNEHIIIGFNNYHLDGTRPVKRTGQFRTKPGPDLVSQCFGPKQSGPIGPFIRPGWDEYKS